MPIKENDSVTFVLKKRMRLAAKKRDNFVL